MCVCVWFRGESHQRLCERERGGEREKRELKLEENLTLAIIDDYTTYLLA